MRVTYETLPKEWSKIKGKMPQGVIDAVEATLPIWEWYHDAEFKPTIDDAIELVNNHLKRIEENEKQKKETKQPDDKKVKQEKTQKQSKPSKEKKEKKEKAQKAKKEFTGEYVEMISPEVSFIKRYISLNNKKCSEVRDKANRILASLQKAIVEKKIRKTSPYADIIMKVQENLIKMIDATGSTTIEIGNYDALKEICDKFKVAPSVTLVKKYLSIQGKTGVVNKAKKLYEELEKCDSKTAEIEDMRNSLKNYIDGKTDTVELSSQKLAGLMGLAGINTTCKSGKAISSEQFLGSVFNPLHFTGKWLKLIGQPSEPFKIMIYGKAGSGKSTLSLQLAKYIASSQNKKVLYVAHEEGFSYTLQEKIRRLNLSDKNLLIIDKLPKDFSDYDCVFIDSINSLGLEADDLRKMPQDKSYIYVFQSTKDGNFRGSQEFEHDVDCSILVEDMTAVSRKNRYGGKESVSV